MPMFKVGCECGYRGEKYLHNEFHRQNLWPCPKCNMVITFMPSFGTPLTYFEEGRARTIWNMADVPITITSPGQHEREMKKHGVALAGQRRGMPSCWA